MEYPPQEPPPRHGRIDIQYARERVFCESFIRRGEDGAPDQLAIPDRFPRPTFVDGWARFDFDNDGEQDDVRIYTGVTGLRVPFALSYERVSGLEAGKINKPFDAGLSPVLGVFFHAGRTHVLLGGMHHRLLPEAGQVSEVLPRRGRPDRPLRHVCRFRRVGEGEAHFYEYSNVY